MIDPAMLLAQQVKCALISEGRCADCHGPLVVPDHSLAWAVCEACSVAYRTSGRGDAFEWEVRMVEHWSLAPLGSDAPENPPARR